MIIQEKFGRSSQAKEKSICHLQAIKGYD